LIDFGWLVTDLQAFPDVDAPFGSAGSFFSITPTRGAKKAIFWSYLYMKTNI
jgi:hypothetical protein